MKKGVSKIAIVADKNLSLRAPTSVGRRHLDTTLKRLMAIVSIAFLLLSIRLVSLQFFSSTHYTEQSTKNMTRTRINPAKRGEIRDRFGLVLAETRTSSQLYIEPSIVQKESLKKLSTILSLNDQQQKELLDEVEHELQREKKKRKPIAVRVLLTEEQLAAFWENRQVLQGVQVQTQFQRSYPEKTLLSHLLGYLGKPNPQEMSESMNPKLTESLLVGRTGLEKLLDMQLQEKPGYEKQWVDGRGRVLRPDLVREMNLASQIDLYREAVPGKNVFLTIDGKFQAEVQKILKQNLRKDEAAGVIVVDIPTGEILAATSYPFVSAEEIPMRIAALSQKDEASHIDSEPNHPLVDKTMKGLYPPGSTFKLATAIAALNDPTTFKEVSTLRVYCTGHSNKREGIPGCDEAHGLVKGFSQAMAHSCNAWFAKAAQLASMNKVTKVAANLGIGSSPGLGVGESSGFLPDEQFYQRLTHRSTVNLGYISNLAIGQGELLASPLQIAMMYAAFANHGCLMKPKIIYGIENPMTEKVEITQPQGKGSCLSISPAVSRLIFNALVEVGKTGTASEKNVKSASYHADRRWLSNYVSPEGEKMPIDVAMKTGTSQVGFGKIPRGQESSLAWERLPHSFIAGIAPAQNPRIAVVVAREHGGYAGKAVGPLLTAILRQYFTTHHPRTGERIQVAPPLDSAATIGSTGRPL